MTHEPENNGLNFDRIDAYNVTKVKREPAQVETEKSGNTRTNVEGTEVVLSNLHHFPGGVTRDNMKYWVGADPETESIAIYMEADGPNLMKPRDWGVNLGFHVGGVYLKYPKMRPSTKLQCDFKFDRDRQGRPCFTFNLAQGLAKKRMGIAGGRPEPEKKVRRRRRKGESSSDAAASNNTKRAPRKKPAPPPGPAEDEE
ncbi:MAG TPA: hypothetical protein VD973_16670 [Symbiobacteriaceae bacterium]|nr:hypothetical protein [Symbiobacteriaceae bacterium]